MANKKESDHIPIPHEWVRNHDMVIGPCKCGRWHSRTIGRAFATSIFSEPFQELCTIWFMTGEIPAPFEHRMPKGIFEEEKVAQEYLRERALKTLPPLEPEGILYKLKRLFRKLTKNGRN